MNHPSPLPTAAADHRHNARQGGRVFIDADTLFATNHHLVVGDTIDLTLLDQQSTTMDNALDRSPSSERRFLGTAQPHTRGAGLPFRVDTIAAVAYPFRIGAGGTFVPSPRLSHFEPIQTTAQPIRSRSIWPGSGQPVLAGFLVEVTPENHQHCR